MKADRLENALKEIADPAQRLSLDLHLAQANISIFEWIEAVLNNTLKWENGKLKILDAKKG